MKLISRKIYLLRFSSYTAKLAMSLLVLQMTLPCAQATEQTNKNNTAAQENAQNSNISMALHPLLVKDGKEYLVTPKGFAIALPGSGVAESNKNVAVYKDANGVYFYIDRNGTPTQIARRASAGGNVKANAPQGQVATVPNRPLMQGNQTPQVIVEQVPQQQQPVIIEQSPPNNINFSPSISSSSGGGSDDSNDGIDDWTDDNDDISDDSDYDTGDGFDTAGIDDGFGDGWAGIPYGRRMFRDGNRMYYNDRAGNRNYVNFANDHRDLQSEWQRQQDYRQDAAGENHPNYGYHGGGGRGGGRR